MTDSVKRGCRSAALGSKPRVVDRQVRCSQILLRVGARLLPIPCCTRWCHCRRQLPAGCDQWCSYVSACRIQAPIIYTVLHPMIWDIFYLNIFGAHVLGDFAAVSRKGPPAVQGWVKFPGSPSVGGSPLVVAVPCVVRALCVFASLLIAVQVTRLQGEVSPKRTIFPRRSEIVRRIM